MNLFKCVVVGVAVVATCISEIAAETPPAVTAAEIIKLPESTNSIGMKFKSIPAGTFTMGRGVYAHEVTLTQPFQIGVHEVTQAQYKQVLGGNPSRRQGVDNPVENVSWDQAVKFCRGLNELSAEKAAGHVYRLPTEAEWEYACLAGTTTKYSFGDDHTASGQYGWYSENSGGKTHPVGVKQPNAWGLYDMHGNVSEWCWDWYGKYPRAAVTDPIGPATGSSRVVRGGGFLSGVRHAISSSRYSRDPSFGGYGNVGFRVVQSSPSE